MRLVKLETNDGYAVYVNPDRVDYVGDVVARHPDKIENPHVILNQTYVRFSEDVSYILVKGTPEDVAWHLLTEGSPG